MTVLKLVSRNCSGETGAPGSPVFTTQERAQGYWLGPLYKEELC